MKNILGFNLYIAPEQENQSYGDKNQIIGYTERIEDKRSGEAFNNYKSNFSIN